MTHSYETWRIYMRRDSLIWDMTCFYETWLTHMRHDSLISDIADLYVTCLTHMRHGFPLREMTHPCMKWLVHMWHYSLMSWLNHMSHVSLTKETRHTHLRHDSSIGYLPNFLQNQGSLHTKKNLFQSNTSLEYRQKWYVACVRGGGGRGGAPGLFLKSGEKKSWGF